jgi:DNA-binding NarL/FixJ family response regulator
VISVVLADDDELIRAGIRLIIEQTNDIGVVGEAGNGREAVLQARRERPDVVLMDVRMPEMDGIEATRRITGLGEGPRVLILTTFELDEYVFDALQAGASGFLLKRSPPETLIEGIRTVARGEGLLSPSITRRLIEEFSTRSTHKTDPRLELLSDREREVLVEMANGLSNEELSDKLFISENTVKTHVKRILTKLEARDRVQAVVMAYQGGLMDR